MDINPIIIWNVLLSLVYAPLIYAIRSNSAEIQRVNILVNRTREEINRDFVSKEDMMRDMERMMDSLDNINKKIDDFLLSNQK